MKRQSEHPIRLEIEKMVEERKQREKEKAKEETPKPIKKSSKAGFGF